MSEGDTVLTETEDEDWTMAEESEPLEVSRRIEAPAALIFKILANPQRHMDFDGSGMVRGAVLDRRISDVGRHLHHEDAFGSETTTSCWTLWRSSSQIGAYFGNRLPETLLGLRMMIHPKFGIPAGLPLRRPSSAPDGDDATVVTEVFDYGTVSEETRRFLVRDGGAWINGTNSVLESIDGQPGQARQDRYRDQDRCRSVLYESRRTAPDQGLLVEVMGRYLNHSDQGERLREIP